MSKIIIGIGIIIICSGLCFWWGYSCNANKYRNNVDQLREQLEEQTDRNRQLQELNTDLARRLGELQTESEREISDYIYRLEQAKRAIGTISVGLSGDIGDIQDVIAAVRRVKEAVSQIGDL